MHQIITRLTDKEKEALNELCRLTGKSQQDYVVAAIFGVPMVDMQIIKELVNEIRNKRILTRERESEIWKYTKQFMDEHMM